MDTHTRRYAFEVRPGHRETLESFSDRVLAANFETGEHKRTLLRQALIESTGAADHVLWAKTLAVKTGRDLTRLLEPRTTRHQDGTQCEHCTSGTGDRFHCGQCAHGETIRQHEHFESNVCLRHKRWVGPNATPLRQRGITVTPAHLVAERTFRKLRRQHLIDAPMYLTLRRLLTHLNEPQGSPRPDARVYPLLMAIAALITSVSFGRAFFNPTNTFASSYAYLRSSLTELMGKPDNDLTRGLWLYSRPTFLSLRESILENRPYRTASPHDFPLRSNVVDFFLTPMQPLEPLLRYLQVTGDDRINKWNYHDVLTHYAHPRPTAPPAPVGHRATICRIGHRTIAASLVGRSRQAALDDNCAYCNHWVILSGFNDMGTTHPHLASELDPAKNNGVSAREIFAGSPSIYIWTCRRAPQPHDFPASASNRSANHSGCPVCLNRAIRIGINDLATLYPEIAGEFNVDANCFLSVDDLAPGSNTMVAWKCSSGHRFNMTVGQRTRGRSCPTCPKPEKVGRTLDISRPDLAAELHPTRNLPRTARDITVGSNMNCIWVCPKKKHVYEQSPERRSAGYGCPLCSGRAYSLGINDPATLHPVICSEWHTYLNGTLHPKDRDARSRTIWWRCRAHAHVTHQTLRLRVRSGGCTKCPADERVMKLNTE
jgi:hypothetical protein